MSVLLAKVLDCPKRVANGIALRMSNNGGRCKTGLLRFPTWLDLTSLSKRYG
jgi:hypothetical protein